MLSLRHPLGLAAAAGLASEALTAGRRSGWRLERLGKRFGATQALDEVSLEIGAGEMVAVTGPSGAGKSTLGRLISGLETPSTGTITIDGASATALPARARRVAHMFESFALYPTRTVQQNIASPLDAPGSAGRWSAAERERRIDDVLALTEMQAYRERLPAQLSGGQKQRVALCRALVQEPSLFLLDEPLGHLDARLRHHLRGEIRRRQKQLRQGTLWLTPDGLEAMAVADRMVVLIGGRVQQIGAPEAVFARPANVRVARLLGDPAMNVVPLRFEGGGCAVGDAPAAPASSEFLARFAPLARGGRLLLGLRPGDLQLRPAGQTPTPRADALLGSVYAVEPLGNRTLVSVEVGGERLRVKAAPFADFAVGAPVRVEFLAPQALSFDADSGAIHD